MNFKFCIAVLLVGFAIVGGGIYEDGPLAAIHGTQTQQNGTTEYMPQAAGFPLAEPNSHNSEELTSQGVHVMGSGAVNHDGYTGKGIKVAVIDSGFDINNPEIAGNIGEYRSFDYPDLSIAGDDIRHGTAASEIIVDVAPDAELYLYNISSAIEFLNLVDYIIERGDIDVVSMSLGFLNSLGPSDGTSVLSQKVNEARESGILWINSAGNFADRHWQGKFTDTDGDNVHDFMPGDESIDITVDGIRPLVLALSWDDWDLTSQDYDLCLFGQFSGEFRIITCSANFQNGFSPPVEIIEYVSPYRQTVHAVIVKDAADRDVNFQLLSVNHSLAEYAVPSSSISIPADALGSLSVGASNWSDDILASYSSQGPTLDGRIKPDVTGPTGVFTTAYCNIFSCRSFHGTSASAPHVAGAAALVMEKYPRATAGQVQAILEATVHERHSKSNLDGTGRVDVSMLAGSDILALDNSNPQCSPCFFPETLSIGSGDSVTWVNSDRTEIQIGGGSGAEAFESGNLARGERYSKTFDDVGTIVYSDTSHPWSSGEIVVAQNPPPDAMPLTLLSAAITSPNQITMVFSEPVDAVPADFTELKLTPGGNRTVLSVAYSGNDTLILSFGGEPVSTYATATVNISVTDARGNAFVNSYEVTVEPAPGSGVEGCQYEPDGCFIPSVATVNVGEVVTFSNTDTVAHTFTAGTVQGGYTGEFDSGLLVAGSSYKYKTEAVGEIPYFCEVHRWMKGTIAVQEGVHVSDGQAPVLDIVSIASSNSQPSSADVGDIVTLAFSASEEITNVAVTINGNDSVPSTIGGNTWTATGIIGSADPGGPVTFSIDFDDVSGNAGNQVNATTDGSAVNIGAQSLATVTGTVFSDTDGNGVQDAGEGGYSGYTMYATDTVTGVQTLDVTASDGRYSFDVVPGNKTIVQTYFFPHGHTVVDPNTSWFKIVTLPAGATGTFNVGFHKVTEDEQVTLDLMVFMDKNGNGDVDAGEAVTDVPAGLFHVYTYTIGPVADLEFDADGATTISDLVPADFGVFVDIGSLRESGYVWVNTDYERSDDHTGKQYDPAVPVSDDPAPGSMHTMKIGLAPAS